MQSGEENGINMNMSDWKTTNNITPKRKKNIRFQTQDQEQQQQQQGTSLYQIPEVSFEDIKKFSVSSRDSSRSGSRSGSRSRSRSSSIGSGNSEYRHERKAARGRVGEGSRYGNNSDEQIQSNSSQSGVRDKYASKLMSNRHVNTAGLYQSIKAKKNSSISVRSGRNGSIILSKEGNTGRDEHGYIYNYGNNNNNPSNGATSNIMSHVSVLNEQNVGVNPMAFLEMKRTRSIRPKSTATITTEKSSNKTSASGNSLRSRSEFGESLHRSKSAQLLKTKELDTGVAYNVLEKHSGNGSPREQIFKTGFHFGKLKKREYKRNHSDTNIKSLFRVENENESATFKEKPKRQKSLIRIQITPYTDEEREKDEEEEEEKDDQNHDKNTKLIEARADVSVTSSNQSPLNVSRIKNLFVDGSNGIVERRNSSNFSSSSFSSSLRNNFPSKKKSFDIGRNLFDSNDNNNITLRSQIKLNAMKSKFDMYNILNIEDGTENIYTSLQEDNVKALGGGSISSPSVMDYIGGVSKSLDGGYSDSQRSSLSLSEHMNYRNRKNEFNTLSYSNSLNVNKTTTNKNIPNINKEKLNTNYLLVSNDLETRLLNEKINNQLNTIKRFSENKKPLYKHISNVLFMQKTKSAGFEMNGKQNSVNTMKSTTSRIKVPSRKNNKDIKTTNEANTKETLKENKTGYVFGSGSPDYVGHNNGDDSEAVENSCRHIGEPDKEIGLQGQNRLQEITQSKDMLEFQNKLFSLKKHDTRKTTGKFNIDIGVIKDDQLKSLMQGAMYTIEGMWRNAELQFENRN